MKIGSMAIFVAVFLAALTSAMRLRQDEAVTPTGIPADLPSSEYLGLGDPTIENTWVNSNLAFGVMEDDSECFTDITTCMQTYQNLPGDYNDYNDCVNEVLERPYCAGLRDSIDQEQLGLSVNV
ncbi:unnamed protein product [Moneuplotes crassus]|uniref:Uncharacterized protein n=1 Tax=Euplotes crassus TaxID=5936 RepID=A0AAD1Y2V9_EUPCR|nr:unnamed protein product [Moneuplotes crassus]